MLQEREQLNSRLQQAERIEAMNFFAGGLAHELANMLQPAVTFSSLARTATTKGDTARVLEQLERIEAAVSRATDITRRTLDYVRTKEDVSAPVQVGHLAGTSQRMLRAVTGGHFKWNIAPEVKDLSIVSEATGLLQILLNLARNAVEAGGLDTEVKIDIHATTFSDYGETNEFAPGLPCVKIAIADNGPGMPREIGDMAFEPLYTTKSAGTGLGLPIVRNMVRRWGGAVSLDSALGQGTVVSIYLPIIDSPQNQANGAGV